ncbi:MAG: MBOAT family O-acyltransferase [Bacillota bacterium]|nr:MBOAT family O-acyltransferase [Bacillota bacterium]
MLFPSEIFLFLFLPIVTLLYYGVFIRNQKAKNLFLFVASLLFYAYGEPVYVFLMLFMIFLHYGFGLLVNHSTNWKKGILFLMVIVDVCLLGYFKYADFLISIVNGIFSTSFPLLHVALPIGISFFTFQAISYVVDVYRGKGEVQTNFLNVGLYIALFPQLIAGPIVRYETIAYEIEHRKENLTDFSQGVTRFIVGLAKKVLLANQFAIVADAVFNGFRDASPTSLSLFWLGAISYTLQIYFDFWGYSDMAIGLGRMFGFHFLENFKNPYIATSISDFWRRWHISLQTWFRDYVYIPLGGSRVQSKIRLFFNIFVVWFLTGIWHGANWTFITWGMMYFVLLMIEKNTSILNKLKNYSYLYTMFFVIIGWVIFRSETLSLAFSYILGLFGIGAQGIIDPIFIQYLRQYAIYYVAGITYCLPMMSNIDRMCKDHFIYDALYIAFILSIFGLSIVYIFNNAYNPFIYFNF